MSNNYIQQNHVTAKSEGVTDLTFHNMSAIYRKPIVKRCGSTSFRRYSITNYYKTFRGCVSPRMSRVRDREHIPISLEKRVNHGVATWGHSWNCKIISVMQYFWSCCNSMQLSSPVLIGIFSLSNVLLSQ